MHSNMRGGRWKLIAATLITSSLALAGCASGTVSGGGDASGGACSTPATKEDVHIYLGVGTLDNDYFQDFITGAKTMATAIGLSEDQVSTYVSDYDGQKLVNTLSSALATAKNGDIIIADPASTAFTKSLVDLAASKGVRIITLWNRPGDIHPWDTGDGCWIAHQSFDMIAASEEASAALFASIGDTGGIVALDGVADNPTAQERTLGLKRALKNSPDVQLLDSQPADWQTSLAQSATEQFLGRFGDEVKAVWAANDDMGFGAVEALRSHGLAGKVPSTGMDGTQKALKMVKDGELAATAVTPGIEEGLVTVALGYGATVGDIDVNELTHEQRDFYLAVKVATAENVDEFLTPFDLSSVTYEAYLEDLWALSAGAVRDEVPSE